MKYCLFVLLLVLPFTVYSHPIKLPASQTADTTMSQNRALIELLLRNGTITREQYESLIGTSSATTDLLDDDDDFGYTATDIRVRRFRVRSEDGRDLFRLRGRLYIDGAVLGLNDHRNTVDDARNNRGELGRYGAIIRNARIGAEGVMHEDFLWRLELDFRDNEVRFRGTYLEYIRLHPFRIMVGNVKEPVGLEWLTSRNRNTFLERAPSLDAYKPDWNLGMRLEYRGEQFNLMSALMSGGGDQRDRQVTGGYALAGRASVAPYLTHDIYTHIGGGASYRVNAFRERIDGAANKQYEDVRKRTRLGTRAVDGRFIGADDITNVLDYTTFNAETAFGIGSFHFQAEYTGMMMQRDLGAENLNLGGYYMQAGYFLTGERKTYRPSRGNFGALTPNRNFRPGFGPGAIELALRYSHVDSIDESYDGGRMDHYTAAINWYLNREVRIMFNYIYLEAERANGKTTSGSVYAIRFMFEF